MSNNITCSKCRHRHPADMTCVEAKARAERMRLEREAIEESLPKEPTELELLRALMQTQIDALTDRVNALTARITAVDGIEP